MTYTEAFLGLLVLISSVPSVCAVHMYRKTQREAKERIVKMLAQLDSVVSNN